MLKSSAETKQAYANVELIRPFGMVTFMGRMLENAKLTINFNTIR